APSGPMLMSHAAASAGETGCPKWGASAASTAPAGSASASTRAAQALEAGLSHIHIGHLALGADAPAGDHVAMFHRERRHGCVSPRFAALGEERGPARLDVAGLVGCPAEQD